MLQSVVPETLQLRQQGSCEAQKIALLFAVPGPHSIHPVLQAGKVFLEGKTHPLDKVFGERYEAFAVF